MTWNNKNVLAAQHDLQILQNLYECNCALLSEWVQNVCHLPVSPVVWYQEPQPQQSQTVILQDLMITWQQLENWGDIIRDLVTYYQHQGGGLFEEVYPLV